MVDLRQISIYGKGGIGKSTLCTNLAVCLAEMGRNVMLVGCSPKADSAYNLLGRMCEPTILDNMRKKGANSNVVDECLQVGYKGIICAEAGGPEPATGCAGRGVFHALQLLKRHRVYERHAVDFVLYDVIADVVCGGFAQPMKDGYASEVFIVTSGELMSLYAANNICTAVVTLNESQKTDVKVGGLIHNMRGVQGERELMAEFGAMIGVPVVANIPRTSLVQAAEESKVTVMQRFPDSAIAEAFWECAAGILEPTGVLPHPLVVGTSVDRISKLLARHQVPSDGLVATNQIPPSFPSAPTAEAAIDGNDSGRRELEIEVPRKIAIYGKGGIGKSTIASNLSVVMSEMGERVMQVGCDPKRDSVALLTHRRIPTILEVIDSGGTTDHEFTIEDLDEAIVRGYRGVLCAESGGPRPGAGCAGQGVMVALESLEKLQVFQRYDISLALFDILGDAICGGFAQPMRGGFCREIYVVANGEPLSLLATNNMLKAVKRLAGEGYGIGVAGIVNNQRGVPNEKEIVETFALRVGVPVAAHVPHSATVQSAEAQGKTVIEAEPQSDQAAVYRQLAQNMLANHTINVPKPMAGMDEIIDSVGALLT